MHNRSLLRFLSLHQRATGPLLMLSLLCCWSLSAAAVSGQEQPAGQTGAEKTAPAEPPATTATEDKLEAGLEAARKSAGQVSDAIGKSAQDIGDSLNQSKTVQDASAGLLKPIYDLSQYMAHPWFYWLAFAIMVAGVVSFTGQVVLTKLLLLLRLHLNFKEMLGDLLGLLISLVGLVLTTQAATQNSTFTSSPAAVLSSAVVGAIFGILFYLWGQGTEFNAARRSRPTPPEPPRK